MVQKTQEQILEIIKDLPEDIKDVFFSEDTGDKIISVCEKYKVPARGVPFVSKYAGYVLLGILPLESLRDVLEKEVGLSKDVSKSLADELNLSIFSQLALPTAKRTAGEKPIGEKPVSSKPDIYHEAI